MAKLVNNSDLLASNLVMLDCSSEMLDCNLD